MGQNMGMASYPSPMSRPFPSVMSVRTRNTVEQHGHSHASTGVTVGDERHRIGFRVHFVVTFISSPLWS